MGLIADRIEQIRAGENRYFVAELETGYVVLGDHQFFEGYTLFLHDEPATELHDLDDPTRRLFLAEMSYVAEAVDEAFAPRKLNYELLGNADPHLHWHIFPRHDDDPVPDRPVWVLDEATRYAEDERPSDAELSRLKGDLLAALQETPATVSTSVA